MADPKNVLLRRAKEHRALARQAEQAAAGGGYDTHREDMAERSRERSAAARDIGASRGDPVPPKPKRKKIDIEDLYRKARAKEGQ